VRVAAPNTEEPAGLVDRLLWRDAQEILAQHVAMAGSGECQWCGRPWPCVPHRCAQRAASAAHRPWNEAWTARHDLYSLRALPGWRSARGGWHRSGNNRSAY
jgi:hypothetical protein